MTEMLRQSLSAVIDDEADAFELRRVLDELNRDLELRAVWDRYNLIGRALRGERRPVRPDMRERIWQALDGDAGETAVFDRPPAAEQPADLLPPEQSATQAVRRKGPIVGLAVAATVAFAVVFGSTLFSTDTDTAVPALAGADVSAMSTVVASPAIGTRDATISQPRGSEVSASDLQRAHAYMLHHTQHQAMNQSSVMSLVKLATYEAP
jgi:sigma-E factor negative regulatory protein RseA